MQKRNNFLQIINFIFAISLSLALLFSISPLFFKEAKLVNKKIVSIQKVDSIKINYTNNRKEYLQLVLITPDKNYIKHYYIRDNEHQNLIEFLVNKKVIRDIEIDNSVPIILRELQLSKFTNIQIENKNGRIKKLIIDNFYVVGNSGSNVKKYMLYLLGVISFTMGIFVLFIIILVVFHYFRTGELPKIPNKIEGLKYLFNGLKK